LSTPWRAGAIAIDMATAVCATLNLAYFLTRLSGPAEAGSRRVALLVLALISLAALLESAVLLASASASGAPALSSMQWALMRAVPFAATVCLSGVIARRVADD